MRRIKPLWLLILAGALLGGVLVVYTVLVSLTQLKTQPGTGMVIGRLDLSSLKGLPYNSEDLYLATFVYSNQSDVAPVISFTYGTDPQTTVHESDGRFAFTNVPPNTYALIMWNPLGGFVIEPPEGGFVKVVVEEGKTTDLGTVVSR